MTSKYDEKIFEFLTETEENFSAACEISENFPKIKERFIKEFWEEVKGELERKNEKGWDIKKEGDTMNKNANLGFWFAGGDIRVIFGGLSSEKSNYYGLWRNYDNKEEFKEKIELYDSEIKKLKDDKEMISNDWRLAYKDTGYDFKTRETLRRILPHNRSEFASELANLLFEFTEEIEEPIIRGITGPDKTNS